MTKPDYVNNVEGTITQTVTAKVEGKDPADVEKMTAEEKAELKKTDAKKFQQIQKGLKDGVAPHSDDAEFLRRVYLNLTGVIPAVEETRAYFADKSADKRAKLIDALLERSEYVDYWSYKWSDLLLVSNARLRPTTISSSSA